MILLDIDGCITAGKGSAVDLIALQTLKEHIANNEQPSTLCTGRSAPYVEAIAQILGIGSWCICENGAYLYNPSTDQVIYQPNISLKARKHLQAIKSKLTTDIQFTQVSKIEMGKEICISLNPIDMSIEALYELVKSHLDLTDLNVAYSTTAVDITPQGINKGSAMQLLCEHGNIAPDETLGVGDTMGDMSFLALCGKVACPHNAIDAIKEMADFVSPSSNTQGLIEIYEWLGSA